MMQTTASVQLDNASVQLGNSGGRYWAHHRYIRAKLRRALLAGMDARELSLAITC